jgi:hypothetical protein
VISSRLVVPDKFLIVRAAYRCVFEHNEIQLEKAQHPRGDSSRRRLMTTTLLLHLDSFARWEGLETGSLTLGYRIDFKGTGGEGGIRTPGFWPVQRFSKTVVPYGRSEADILQSSLTVNMRLFSLPPPRGIVIKKHFSKNLPNLRIGRGRHHPAPTLGQ